MKGKTAIGAALDAAGAKAQYDGHVKRILGNRQVLARILKGASEEFREYSRKKSSAGLSLTSRLRGQRCVREKQGRVSLLSQGTARRAGYPEREQ